ncbi:MAG TPA: glycosyl hydrolase family 65 protein [Bacillota bacterium]
MVKQVKILEWIVQDDRFRMDHVEQNGNKYLIANGYMGYRGTLEEYSKDQLVACILSGIYDRVGNAWREPVNAPNGFLVRLICDGEPLSVLDSDVKSHSQSLDIQNGIHHRKTTFRTKSGKRMTVASDRFTSLANVHMMAMRYSIQWDHDSEIEVITGIDGDIWDINGPHLENPSLTFREQYLLYTALTHELGHKVVTAETIICPFGNQDIDIAAGSIFHRIRFRAQAENEYRFIKYVTVFTSVDASDPEKEATDLIRKISCGEYDHHLADHMKLWHGRWDRSDVQINGDPDAQQALRYSIYQLLSIAPTHTDKTSIPARGLSGQTYKGAVFWDTEMFMLPFFIYTQPEIARKLMKYRYHALDGARRKAAEYGFRGAFYAWESQETGADACTHFNVTDVFTGRPLRTYFRDKQIHISADVAYGIWQYYALTGDAGILLDGGAEVILECARFFYSYSYYQMEKQRYEILDVTGPDEYHERVNNNAFTNQMVKHTLDIALKVGELLQGSHPDFYRYLLDKLDYHQDFHKIKEMSAQLYIPQPDQNSGVIEQFDGYHHLEDISLPELRKRVLNPNEYWGGGNGIASTTKILKQADTILMLHIFKNDYSDEIKKANWCYYEPRTEHGSSLSACVYALVAADCGDAEWGYQYFMKTATIDLTGESKQYVGTLYIGGTHPAANGGAWMAAVLGFAGLNSDGETLRFNPCLPAQWESIAFKFEWQGCKFGVVIDQEELQLESDQANPKEMTICINGEMLLCKAGQQIKVLLTRGGLSYDEA